MTRVLRLDIDADPALLGTARLFAAAAARLAGCTDDVVEDVRLAVSEACTRAIAGSPERARLVLQTRLLPSGLEVEVRGPAAEPPASVLPDVPAIDLVPALFPDSEEHRDGDTLTIRFVAPLG